MTARGESTLMARPGGGGDPCPEGPERLEGDSLDGASAENLQDRLLRLRAEFDNYRRRIAREREEDRETTIRSFVSRLLPVLDALEGALQAPTTGEAEAFRQGVAQIHSALLSVLEAEGIEEVPGEGRPFDPNLHEAVGQIESPGAEPGSVVDVTRKGYRMKDRLIRPALVRVAAGE